MTPDLVTGIGVGLLVVAGMGYISSVVEGAASRVLTALGELDAKVEKLEAREEWREDRKAWKRDLKELRRRLDEAGAAKRAFVTGEDGQPVTTPEWKQAVEEYKEWKKDMYDRWGYEFEWAPGAFFEPDDTEPDDLPGAPRPAKTAEQLAAEAALIERRLKEARMHLPYLRALLGGVPWREWKEYHQNRSRKS